ncbi:kinase domain protein (macronuclear) [Tetrahymena thermophila SB210]|uniref:Kinase domain protein n=1 Tax=Tetrahymena thermophila (strain SB210) TaxID=312017 RepID=Q228M3_TETTS|nr:kinase domain protein [Tetrahymena thermophila SB210]EAR81740.2 kinase domain protein [Tetrahymena thermophila SB210]|eukprot:XP_001029403.2 kinase domain protein [Tetrahymena thermophila SB210]
MQNRIFEGEKSKYQQNRNLQIQGGQASIYFAIDLKNYQQVVIKEYFKDSSFQVDYAVLKKIQDKYSENLEYLVKIYDQSSENEKMKFIVIEYCNQGDLYKYLIKKQQEVQTLEQAIKVIDIAIQITKGMMILKELNLAIEIQNLKIY